MSSLSSQEREHYQRHISLEEIGESGQMKLKMASVLVVGAGGLGCPALQYLAGAGIGRIGIVDDDRVEKSNLQRQTLFDYDDIGHHKADVAAAKLSQKNPHIEIKSFNDRLTVSNVESLLADYSIVLDGSDNFQTRYLINDACILYQKTLIYGSIFQFTGQVSVFNYNNGPTYRCLFPELPDQNVLPNCSEIGVLGVLPGIVGTYQALEVIKLITGVGEVLSGKLLLIDALKLNFSMVSLKRNPNLEKASELKSEQFFCGSKESISRYTEVSPAEAKSLLNQEDWLLIDVRENWEREIHRIDPSIHIPLSKFNDQSDLSLPDGITLNSKIIIYCKAGVRSRSACDILATKGFLHLYNLSGGIMQWEEGTGN